MRSEYSRILTFVCILFALDGCNTPPAGPAATSCAPIADALVDPSFKTGFGILSGMFAPQAASSENAGDSLLLGVKVTDGQQDDIWFVRLSMLPPRPVEDTQVAADTSREFSVPFGIGAVKTGTKMTVPTNRVLIETYDHQGTPLRSSVRAIPQLPESATLLDLWRELASPAGSLFQTQAISNQSLAGMMMSLQSLGASRALRPIRDAVREEVIKQPKILGLLLRGLRFTVEADFSQSQLIRSIATADEQDGPRYQIDFPVSLTGQHMFDCRLIVGPAQGPYSLLGGALLFEASHPDKPLNRVSVRVLAAKDAGNPAGNSMPGTSVADSR